MLVPVPGVETGGTGTAVRAQSRDAQSRGGWEGEPNEAPEMQLERKRKWKRKQKLSLKVKLKLNLNR